MGLRLLSLFINGTVKIFGSTIDNSRKIQPLLAPSLRTHPFFLLSHPFFYRHHNLDPRHCRGCGFVVGWLCSTPFVVDAISFQNSGKTIPKGTPPRNDYCTMISLLQIVIVILNPLLICFAPVRFTRVVRTFTRWACIGLDGLKFLPVVFHRLPPFIFAKVGGWFFWGDKLYQNVTVHSTRFSDPFLWSVALYFSVFGKRQNRIDHLVDIRTATLVISARFKPFAALPKWFRGTWRIRGRFWIKGNELPRKTRCLISKLRYSLSVSRIQVLL